MRSSAGGGKAMRAIGLLFCAAAVVAIAAACLPEVPVDTKAPRIAKEELMAIMGRSNVTVVDVRTERDWKSSDRKIKGAVREDPEKDVKGWASKYTKDQELVFY
jgi:hypothetical protein